MPQPPPAADTRITPDLVQGLIDEFAPSLRDQPIEFFAAGWDNEMYRIGEHHLVRLPRRQISADLVVNEQTWLPTLAPRFAVAVPVPVLAGRPTADYPYPWSLLQWIPGQPLAHSPPTDHDRLARDLARFITALSVPAAINAPTNSFRGVPLTERDARFRESVAECGGLIDHDRVVNLWDELVATPGWHGEPVWLHGDLHPLNLLVREDRLCAVIDWGDITAGDPAVNLYVAWMLFGQQGREQFRSEVRIDGHPVDSDTWKRARGWALALAVAFIAHSKGEPIIRQIGDTTLDRLLD